MDPDLASLCQQTVTYQPQSAVDSFGKPSEATVYTFAARVENKVRNMFNAAGQVVATRGKVYLVPVADGRPIPQVGGILTLPATEVPRTPPIAMVQTDVDEVGVLDSIVVYFA